MIDERIIGEFESLGRHNYELNLGSCSEIPSLILEFRKERRLIQRDIRFLLMVNELKSLCNENLLAR